MVKKVISLFTGAGGLDWAFLNNKGYELVFSNEKLEDHLQTFAQNHKIPLISIENYNNEENVAIFGDICNLNVSFTSDILIGGPPCQDFSVLRGDNKRNGFTVERGKLYEQYLRILKISNPSIFVFENVVGMVSANDGLAYKTIIKDFEDQGYDLIYNQLLNISDIGAPQSRRRLIIIGIKKGLISNIKDVEKTVDKYLFNNLLKKYPLTPLEVFEGKVLTELNQQYVRIMKAYGHCMDGIDNECSFKWKTEYENLNFDVVEDYLYYNNVENFIEKEFEEAMLEHKKILKILGYYNNKLNWKKFDDFSNVRYPVSKRVEERIKHTPPFYNFNAVEGTEWEVKGLISNTYKRLHPLKPSPTVVAYGGGGTGGYHYLFNRIGLTNRERARLQTFPDDYLFNGNLSQIRAQIGEAVPPIASYFIFKTISEILNLIE